jgi:hypothetical protein
MFSQTIVRSTRRFDATPQSQKLKFEQSQRKNPDGQILLVASAEEFVILLGHSPKKMALTGFPFVSDKQKQSRSL